MHLDGKRQLCDIGTLITPPCDALRFAKIQRMRSL